MHLSTGARLGPYEILSAVGAGGMGEVYRARDTRLDRDVAIKVLPPDLATNAERLTRFEREAKATAALSHPNILAVHDVGTHDGVPYLVEELLDGESLRQRLAQGAIPVGEAVAIAVQVAHGLAAAHGRHIVHRDLKPENVFLTRDGTVKILDFGLAKLVEGAPDGDADTLTHAPTGATALGRVLGTVAYMAPEQARGMPVDHRADIFAFGVVLHEMVAGQRPFSGETATDTIAAILKEEPLPLPEGVPLALQAVVTQCLAKRPEQRFSSAHDLALALQAASRPGDAAHGAVAQVEMRVFAGRRRLLPVAGIFLIVAVVGVLAIWQPWRIVSPPPGSAAPRLPSIVALPCKVYGAPEVAFLTDAVPSTISTLLAQVDGLDTKVPPSSLEVDKVKGDLARLAELYQVSSFVLTSITTSSGRYVLDVRLVDAATKQVRWGQQYEGPREAYIDLAHQAADGIRQAVKPASSPVPATGVSSDAEMAFRQGAYFANRYNNLNRPADFDAALAAYTRVLALDPTLAAAAGQVAALYMFRFDVEGDAHEARKHAESWARRALGIDPRCGEAWATLSAVELYATHADPERGIDYAVKAVAFAPRGAGVHATLGQWVSTPGSMSLAVAAGLRALDLDPFLLTPSFNVATSLCLLGRSAEALPIIDRALQVEPDFMGGFVARGFALLRLGRLEEAESALQHCERAVNTMHTGGELWRQIRLALAVVQRDTATSETLARQILASAFDPGADANLVANAAIFAVAPLARLGRTNDAIGILQRSVEVGAVPAYDLLLGDPDIQRLRGDPRFAKVLAASRDGAAMLVRILGKARSRGELPKYLEAPLDDLVRLLEENDGTK
jgi:tetratricopeptide (TPR) repeat protein